MSNRIKLKAPFLQECSEQNTPQTDLNDEESSSEDESVSVLMYYPYKTHGKCGRPAVQKKQSIAMLIWTYIFMAQVKAFTPW